MDSKTLAGLGILLALLAAVLTGMLTLQPSSTAVQEPDEYQLRGWPVHEKQKLH